MSELATCGMSGCAYLVTFITGGVESNRCLNKKNRIGFSSGPICEEQGYFVTPDELRTIEVENAEIRRKAIEATIEKKVSEGSPRRPYFALTDSSAQGKA